MNFINANKTKITGALLAIISLVQASSPTIQAFIPPPYFALFTVGVGALVTFFGFLNTAAQNAAAKAYPQLTPAATPPSPK